MDRKQALFTLGREQKQFDLAALNEIDHPVLVAAGVNIRVARDRHSARVQGLVPQRIAHLLFKPFRFGSLLNHDWVFSTMTLEQVVCQTM
jgi:hypothetical protein